MIEEDIVVDFNPIDIPEVVILIFLKAYEEVEKRWRNQLAISNGSTNRI